MTENGKKNDRRDEPRGLACRECSSRRFRVIYTRPAWGGKIVRRREFLRCATRVTTWECAIGEG